MKTKPKHTPGLFSLDQIKNKEELELFLNEDTNTQVKISKEGGRDERRGGEAARGIVRETVCECVCV
jgi:hypothetical protein